MSKLKVKYKDNQIIVNSRLGKTEEVNQQELQIMRSKIIRGLMKPSLVGEKKITYIAPIGITLKKYLANYISINDFFLVFAQILEIVKSVDRNSFNIINLVLNLNYSFINERTKEVHFVYQPIRSQAFSTSLASFLYDVAYSVNLGLSENYKEINDLISFMNSMPRMSVEDIEQYVSKNRHQINGKASINNGENYENSYMPETVAFIDTDDSNQMPDTVAFIDMDDSNEMPDTVAFIDTDDSNEMPDTVAFIDTDDSNEMPDTVAFIDSDNSNEMPDTMAFIDTDDSDEMPATEAFFDSSEYAHIIRVKTGEKIIINKPNFVIGKSVNNTDYCIKDNNTVSRIHASIILYNNEFFLMDLGSVNHSFVEGVLAVPNEKYKLFKGSRFYLSNEEFIFNFD